MAFPLQRWNGKKTKKNLIIVFFFFYRCLKFIPPKKKNCGWMDRLWISSIQMFTWIVVDYDNRFFCHVKFCMIRFEIFFNFMMWRDKQWVFLPSIYGMGQRGSIGGFLPNSMHAWELVKAKVHIHVNWVYAGAVAPTQVTSATFSHWSTCEMTHTSHNWSMTISTNRIRCFFYVFLFFTQIFLTIVH